ncbi:MAG TPA: hypothetical protein VGB85_13965, partial [Nannocystis sp.]
PGSLAGLLGAVADRRAAVEAARERPPAPAVTCPEGQVCTDGAAGQTCPAGQACVAQCTCPAGQPGCAPGCGSRPEAPVVRRRPRAGEDLATRLRRLDDAAEALLGAGDLAGADERYVEIAAIGGTRPEVEHAFADRFGLARTRRDTASQRRLWRAYLERFPRGGFADDAHAGLCRTAPDDEHGACWARYLENFPAGAHRREAGEQESP